jgi:hypothetical protein
MQATIEHIFDDVENRYLPQESLKQVHLYVKSLPERITAYRTLRDRETVILQKVADQLQKTFPDVPQEALERSLRYAMLTLRQCAMAMLMEDHNYLEDQLISWLRESVVIHGTAKVDRVLYSYLKKVMVQALSAKQFTLLNPLVEQVEGAVLNPTAPNPSISRPTANCSVAAKA